MEVSNMPQMGAIVGNNTEYIISCATIVGNKNKIEGDNNTIIGNGNQVYGDKNSITGNMNLVRGQDNKVLGIQNDSRISENKDNSSSFLPANNSCFDFSQSNSREIIVNVCKKVRVCTDSQGKQSSENIHVELTEECDKDGKRDMRGSASSSSSCTSGHNSPTPTPDQYDLKFLTGVDTVGEPECTICQTRQRCVKLGPCRHVPLCLFCTKSLFSGTPISTVKCPLCRTKVDDLERLFI